MLQAHKDLHGTIREAVIAAQQDAQDMRDYARETQQTSSMGDMNDAHIYSTNQTQFDKSNLRSPEDKTASRGSVDILLLDEPTRGIAPIYRALRPGDPARYDDARSLMRQLYERPLLPLLLRLEGAPGGGARTQGHCCFARASFF
jgi:hypothetical protein